MRQTLLAIVFVFFLAGCSSAARLPASPTVAATPLASPTLSLAPTDTPTATLIPTATAIRTPSALPQGFTTTLLNPVDPPHTYIANTCQYLQDKWSSNNSAPGTVVIPVMFHSIMAPGDTIGANQISQADFTKLMGGLESRGFKAITTAQLADFLYHNGKIPPRSVILIVDDRHHAAYFNQYFLPWWQGDHWPVVNAWISAARDSIDAALWLEQETLNSQGWVDYEAHGVVHNTPMWPGVSDAYIMGELKGSIDAFKAHFNKVPIAIIWPGGGFSARSIQIARQLGYQLGFTVNARGPLMFNWVPLGDQITSVHGPAWQPEGPMNDPLMVLPRYWDTDALKHLDDIVKISQDASAYAQQNKATELEYYDIMCAPTLGQMP
ncbi:MAG TPA: polysaccharide deacetylase family protein [Anaerolineales bacterium]|nr:polysaccharide deacetylase family protein [Anaerolineales bacterium]